jgi:hypothetical protein
MGRFDDALYAAANADDPRVGQSFEANKTSSRQRIAATRATILRFLQAVDDESLTVLELREELE